MVFYFPSQDELLSLLQHPDSRKRISAALKLRRYCGTVSDILYSATAMAEQFWVEDNRDVQQVLHRTVLEITEAGLARRPDALDAVQLIEAQNVTKQDLIYA